MHVNMPVSSPPSYTDPSVLDISSLQLTHISVTYYPHLGLRKRKLNHPTPRILRRQLHYKTIKFNKYDRILRQDY